MPGAPPLVGAVGVGGAVAVGSVPVGAMRVAAAAVPVDAAVRVERAFAVAVAHAGETPPAARVPVAALPVVDEPTGGVVVPGTAVPVLLPALCGAGEASAVPTLPTAVFARAAPVGATPVAVDSFSPPHAPSTSSDTKQDTASAHRRL